MSNSNELKNNTSFLKNDDIFDFTLYPTKATIEDTIFSSDVWWANDVNDSKALWLQSALLISPKNFKMYLTY